MCATTMRVASVWMLAVAVAVLATVNVGGVAAARTEVDTEYGRIRGDNEPEARLTGFYGIPFAAPPVKDLRLQPPVPPTPWNKTLDCTVDKFFHTCPQFHITKNIFYGQEDCLYMNIYVPDEAEKEPVPVLFWIYGGGFDLGDEFEFGFYRAKNLAKKRRVIVVETNYRLGALGFLANEHLRASNPLNTTGNFGVQDQQAALQFVHRNIAKFGGDPSRITIFGESAGAMSVCFHVVNPISRSLFAAAIMESGTCSSAEFFVSLKRAYQFGDELLKKAGCSNNANTLECLRGLKTEDFFATAKDWPIVNGTAPPLAPVMPWGPTIDGSKHGLPDRPINMIRRGEFAKVPMIIGTNHDEGTIFVPAFPKVVPGVKLPLSTADFNRTLLHFFNHTTLDQIVQMYPEHGYKNNDLRAAYVLRDFFFLCASREALDSMASQNITVYMYQFNLDMNNWIDYDILGNYHTSELPFVFDNEWPPLVHDFDEKERRMAETFGLYWSNMARYGDPNHNLGPDQATWPAYTPAYRSWASMTVPVAINTQLEKAKCDFWQSRYTKYYFDGM